MRDKAWARELMVQGTPETSVITVALDVGVSHVGRFAGLYRDRFGELPSAVLRRRLG